MAEIIVPVLESFRPELLMISAGYDAHQRDPLASMRVSTHGFTAIVSSLWELAIRRCSSRVVVVTEGGYDREALAAGLQTTIDVLAEATSPRVTLQGEVTPASDAIEAVRAILKPYWPTL
jgi:acetoin utilization deacetylase AcuC-like enzyme